MFRFAAARTMLALAGAAATGLLTLAPAGATPPPKPGVQIPWFCTGTWTNVIRGTPGPDELVGTKGNDLIIGLGGDDTITGSFGDDILLGGDGDDLLIGGDGDDCIDGGPGDDESVEYYEQPNGSNFNFSVLMAYEY